MVKPASRPEPVPAIRPEPVPLRLPELVPEPQNEVSTALLCVGFTMCVDYFMWRTCVLTPSLLMPLL